jgi:hypothetical protein
MNRYRTYFEQVKLKSSAVKWIHIRIRIGLDVLDPDPYWECRSGSGSRSTEIDKILTNKPGFLPFKKAFVPS